jgi:hypothetical protein
MVITRPGLRDLVAWLRLKTQIVDAIFESICKVHCVSHKDAREQSNAFMISRKEENNAGHYPIYLRGWILHPFTSLIP